MPICNAVPTRPVLYEVPVQALTLTFGGGRHLDVTAALSNGRSSYVVFQALVAHLVGLVAGTEGAGSDLRTASGAGLEVKAYRDPELWPQPGHDRFHTAASSTFGPNNHGPTVRRLLEQGDYGAALTLCRRTGYDHNDIYVYTNTGSWDQRVPLRFLLVPTRTVLRMLDRADPRLIDRRALLAAAGAARTL